jgi:GH15 family glucan-1,4-alpha-glucosidase
LGGNPADGHTELDAPGYRQSHPVRAGNSASAQTQLGTYGDFFNAIHRYIQAGHLLDAGTARLLVDLAERCCDTWMRRDSGIWELHEPEHFTISKIGCWTALDRAIRLAESDHLPADRVDRWRGEVEQISGWVRDHCWSDELQAYTLYAGSTELDAAVLLAGRTGFDRGHRLRQTIEACSNGLGIEGTPLLYRYSGMEKEEGAFVACTFWMVEALVWSGQLARAISLMNSAIGFVNNLGILAEQIDPADGSYLGNIPQGLSHLALINAAHAIAYSTDTH